MTDPIHQLGYIALWSSIPCAPRERCLGSRNEERRLFFKSLANKPAALILANCLQSFHYVRLLLILLKNWKLLSHLLNIALQFFYRRLRKRVIMKP